MQEMPLKLNPALYVVATPIGNDGDLSPRARDVLTRADAVLAEDTRRAGLLFSRLGIVREKKGFLSLHEHNEEGRIPQVIGLLAGGGAVALISDAGTPVLADPGYRLARACREAGLRVVPVPGPFAPAAALSACGLPPAPFTFLGFLPRKSGDVKRLLARHAASGASLVFFERKDRLAETLELAAQALGDREFAVCRELTKTHEEIFTGRLSALDMPKLAVLGEVTVVIGPEALDGAGPLDGAGLDLDAVMAEERARGGKPREVARRVAERVGASPKEIYERMVKGE